MDASIDTYSKLAVGTANPPTTALEWLGPLAYGKRGTVFLLDGIRGTRSRSVERTRDNIYTVGGTINLQPCPPDLDVLLPLIAGGTKVGNNIPIAETLPSFYVGVDKIAQMYLYSGNKVASATFTGSSGNPLGLTLNCEGLTETAGAISGLTGLTPSTAKPYMFHDATLTVGGVTHEFRECSVTLDNGLILDRFMNSQSRTEIPEADRAVQVSLSLPFNATTLSLYDTGATSAAVILTWTFNTLFFKITLPAVQFPANQHEMAARAEIMLPLIGMARKTGSTAEITFDNKSS